SFDAFFGNPKAMTPGVRVHFTACKEKVSLIATDVKVAPGGTENVDTEIYEAVVSQPIIEPQVSRQYPGQVHVNIGPLRTNLTFDRKDSTVTLLKNDQVLINLLTDIVTEKRRATNIKPKIPATFSHTKEAREKGIVIEFSEGSGLIKCTQNPQLFFHMSEVIEKKKLELNEKVEFSVVPHETAEGGNQAIRIKRYTESVFFPVRKLGGVGTNKGKVREQTFLLLLY
uniref:CSD domain-containing protein n=1 Tax=Echeneis naucrates TaxID=173247 RepID=A0A665WZ64_ECHNA